VAVVEALEFVDETDEILIKVRVNWGWYYRFRREY
jgi:hypothetical protein